MAPSTLRAGSERRIERLAGLCAFGSGRLGPFRMQLPALLDVQMDTASRAAVGGSSAPILESAESDPAFRRLQLVGAEGRWTVEFPIPAPEVAAGTPFVFETPDHVALVHGPPDIEALNRWRAEPPALIILTNARALWTEGEPFVEAVGRIREAAGPAPVLWAPRVALPHRMAFLTYIGIDVLDVTEGLFLAAEGKYLDPQFGVLEERAARNEFACSCPGCEPPGSLTQHAVHALRSESVRVRTAALEGRLRDLTESRLPSDPRLGEFLRYADRRLAGLLEETTPVERHTRERYVLAEAARRPEVVRFRERFLVRYRPPKSKRILLMVPCSETKPYRRSPSHRRFLRALDGLRGLERVHIVSVTSPLGLVPRELEDIFPAAQYDVPVTGEWSESERDAVRSALAHVVATGSYRQIIFHLDPEEYAFLRDPGRPWSSAEWTVSGSRPGSSESLAALREAISRGLASETPPDGGPLSVVREELAAVAAFQFEAEAAARLFAEPVRLAGRPWFQRIIDAHHADLATWREERGLFQLTVAGGIRMLPAHPLEVEMDPAVPLDGDLFCPGVVRADPRIRIGDACLLVSAGWLRGVGEAALPGTWMSRLAHGLAVRVRHRNHSAPGSAREATGT